MKVYFCLSEVSLIETYPTNNMEQVKVDLHCFESLTVNKSNEERLAKQSERDKHSKYTICYTYVYILYVYSVGAWPT